MTKIFIRRTLITLTIIFLSGFGMLNAKDLYELRVYTIESKVQEAAMDNYLESAYVPALHRAGIEEVGVFKSIDKLEDESIRIFVFIPFSSLKELEKVNSKLEKDKAFSSASSDFNALAFDNPPYKRLEIVLMDAFSYTPEYKVPKMDTKKSDRVYELRSYESATEELHRRKVKMFNEGEAQLFIDLGFQPMFFGSVISGVHMPNLMYMTCHSNSEAQEKNWKAFVDHPTWNKLKVMDIYQNTVSHIDKWMLYPTEYSDL